MTMEKMPSKSAQKSRLLIKNISILLGYLEYMDYNNNNPDDIESIVNGR
jgi:hypothetical protein